METVDSPSGRRSGVNDLCQRLGFNRRFVEDYSDVATSIASDVVTCSLSLADASPLVSSVGVP